MKRLILLPFLLVPVLLMSEEPKDQRFDLSISAAVALPGIIEASLEEGFPEESSLLISSRVSPAVKLVAEYYLIPWLAPSIAVHYAALYLPEDVDLDDPHAEGRPPRSVTLQSLYLPTRQR